MFIPTLNSKCVFKHPFGGGKTLSLRESFERTKIALFCLFVCGRLISFSISLTKGLHFAIEKK